MISNQDKSEVIQQVCKSKTFAKATTQRTLLEYLAKATSDGINLKEFTIANEFFGEEIESAKSSTRVRVAIYNLRKKLANYYENEGKEDLLRINIEKGQYAVNFEKNTSTKFKVKKRTLFQIIPWGISVVLFITIWLQFKPLTAPDIWKAFNENKKSTNVYIGDYFGFRGNTITGNEGWTRDYSINNLEDYYSFKNKNPGLLENTEPANYSHLTISSVQSINSIAKFSSIHKLDYNIRLSSKALYSELKEDNTIYIGATKNDNKFIELFNNHNPYFNIDSNLVHFSKHPTLPDTSYFLNLFPNESDLTVVARLKGENATEQFFFFSNHDMGITATVDYFTNLDSINSFSERYLSESEYFIAIIDVQGINRTNFKLEIDFVVDLGEK